MLIQTCGSAKPYLTNKHKQSTLLQYEFPLPILVRNFADFQVRE